VTPVTARLALALLAAAALMLALVRPAGIADGHMAAMLSFNHGD
jgi:hypothetical protein